MTSHTHAHTHILLNALIWCELGVAAEVFTIIVQKVVETFWEHITLVHLQVLSSTEPLRRVQLCHVTYHSLHRHTQYTYNVMYLIVVYIGGDFERP